MRKLDLDGKGMGNELIAVDTAGAGLGRAGVVLKEGGSALMGMGVESPPPTS